MKMFLNLTFMRERCFNIMYPMMLLVLLSSDAIAKFHIEKSGIFPVDVDHIGIRFWLKIVNNADYPIIIKKARQPECCWLVEHGDMDCQSMLLIGGFQAEIKSKTHENMTFIFSNQYPLDRKGSCKFHIKEHDKKGTLIHEIKFDTTIKESLMKRLKSGVLVYKQCNGIDENIRNNCYPFDCARKYNGFRSFYRVKLSKCEPVARCTTRLGTDDLPTTAFDFEHNRCKDLLKGLSEKEKNVAEDILDASPLAKERNQYVDVNPEDLVIDCKNGLQEGRHCRCHRGWKTVSAATKNGGLRMNWCSKKVKVLEQTQAKRNKYVRYSLLIILIMFCISLFILLVCLWWQLFMREVIQKVTTDSTNDEDESEYDETDDYDSDE